LCNLADTYGERMGGNSCLVARSGVADSSPQSPSPRRLDVATAAGWAASGVSPAHLRRLVRQGKLLPLRRGVYARASVAAAATHDSSREHALRVAAALAVTRSGAVASHQSAAVIHGVDLFGRRPSDVVSLTRPPANRASHSGWSDIRVHTAQIAAEHVARLHGVPVTSAARTVIDLARALPFRDGVVVADSALHTGKTTKPELQAVVAHCVGWPGIKSARHVVEFSDSLSESVLESITRVALHEHGLPPPALQVKVGSSRFVGRVDFLWAEYATILEADGALKYADTRRAIDQLERDELLREAGFQVVHCTWNRILHEPEVVIAAIRQAFRRAAASS
jgi:Transcriptional regulator, AbiEi antitoxin/Protein of unknown function (DUF559)